MKKSGFVRLFSGLLVLCALVGLACPAEAYTNLSAWAKSDFQEAEKWQILPDGFQDADLQGHISRYEMCQLAVKAYVQLTGIQAYANRTDYFTDTDDVDICVAYEAGIVSGYADGSFQPDRLLTRQEFFQIVSNLIHAAGVKTQLPPGQDFLTPFADRDQLGSWAKEAASLLVALDVVKGTQSGSTLLLNPNSAATRQEAVVLFLRAFKIVDEYLNSDWLTEEQIKELQQAAKDEQASEEAQKLIALALSYVGSSYVFGGKSPETGFDCSGFTYYVFQRFGYTLNRVADDQALNGTPVEYSQLKPGDLILFSNTYRSSDWITHVGIYIGDGKIVHAANSKRGVTVDSIASGYYRSHYAGARRILQ